MKKPRPPSAARPGFTRPFDVAQAALRTVNQIPAMVAYWDRRQRCVFANDAYRVWFNRNPSKMRGMTLKELLEPVSLYEKNLPHIQGALQGRKQVFERQLPHPKGGIRETIATYTPDIVAGVVRGFSVQVADVTAIREREAALERAIKERDEAVEEAKSLKGLLPICAGCKSIRDPEGEWHKLEPYVSKRTSVTFTHSICPDCSEKFLTDLERPKM